jgi:hypothetical protein
MKRIKAGDTVYFVKYALSSGITKETVKEDVSDDGLVCLVGWSYTYGKIARDVFVDLQDAIEAAEIMLNKKIKSLEKQIAKLKKMEFKV